MRLALRRDTHWWRSRDGIGLLAGAPGTFFRVSEAGGRVLDAVENGETVDSSPLTDRLVAGGAAHPEPGAPVDPADLTVVIPCFAADENVAARAVALADSLAPLPCVIVDDASPVPVETSRHRVVRRTPNGGPGAARNTGLQHVDTQFVAFVDDDITVSPTDLLRLTGHFADANVSFVAPRVVTTAGTSLVSQYESIRSPLDMGDAPARVRPRSSVPYVPSAVFVARVAAFARPFDESMRYGEDVEFVWRAQQDDAQCRYEPSVQVRHLARPGLGALLRQRFRYGSSAAAIDTRIPWSVAPVQGNLFHVLPGLLLLMGQSFWAVNAAFVSVLVTFLTVRRFRLGTRNTLRVAWLSVRYSTRHTATAITREWFPVFIVLGGFMVQFDFAFWLSLSGLIFVDIVRKRPANPAWFIPVRALDSFAYGIGVWAGAVRQRNARCLLPRLSVRPSARGA